MHRKSILRIYYKNTQELSPTISLESRVLRSVNPTQHNKYTGMLLKMNDVIQLPSIRGHNTLDCQLTRVDNLVQPIYLPTYIPSTYH